MKRFTKIDGDGFNCGDYEHLKDAIKSIDDERAKYFDLNDDDCAEIDAGLEGLKIFEGAGLSRRGGCAVWAGGGYQINRNF